MRANAQIRLNKAQREAEGYLELGLPQYALRTLARLGEPSSFGPVTLFLWGEALRAMDRYEEAIGPLKQAAARDSENIHVWVALGWCYKRTGRLDQAIAALESALSADPSEALLHYNLACYLTLARSKERALVHLARALAIDANYRSLIDKESDFDTLRNDPDFQALTMINV